jgi:hypothetical protein
MIPKFYKRNQANLSSLGLKMWAPSLM